MKCKHCNDEIICINPWVGSNSGPYHEKCYEVAVTQPAAHREELRALYEKVFLAALSGLCANSQISNRNAAIAEAHATATETIRQHAEMIADRDAAIEVAIRSES